ncbi:MAG: excinuclease ABC subunit UvrC [Pseudomonadota bacterium]
MFDSKSFLSQLTTQPGVYRMYGAGEALLYVGKARNLKKRVSSYFLRASGDARIESMVEQIRRIEVTVTHTEDEALLLEATLIKELHPRYNILYRDDKSYPYLRFTAHPFPRIGSYRGARSGKDRYFGPYVSSVAVRESALILQKLFRLRPCNDHFFSHRQRPCLQHQIKRCSAPCVGLIDEESYARDVRNAERLLMGKGEALGRELQQQMEQASQSLDYERAAQLRDQIAALSQVQQSRTLPGTDADSDVIALALHAAHSCIVVMSLRGGLNLGHRSYFPSHPHNVDEAELLSGFLSQFYLDRNIPQQILVSRTPADADWIERALSQRAGRHVSIKVPSRGERLRLMAMAVATAAQALSARLTGNASMQARLSELQEALGLEELPERLECFDISHTGGESTVASCVVFNAEGPLKAAYRKFNIEGVAPGDDYAAIKQSVLRRYLRVKDGEAPAPDLLFIDGGQGQLTSAMEALTEAGIENLRVVAIAKGPTRKPGLEQLFLPGREQPLVLPADSAALHLIQRIRDEAHRFAIQGHRGQRDKARFGSALDEIEGLGPMRKRELLRSLGGLAQVKRAGVDELARIKGISRAMAERIHAQFH